MVDLLSFLFPDLNLKILFPIIITLIGFFLIFIFDKIKIFKQNEQVTINRFILLGILGFWIIWYLGGVTSNILQAFLEMNPIVLLLFVALIATIIFITGDKKK